MTQWLGKMKNWIFDMDGTLTVPIHDFPAIKQKLGIRVDSPILEQISEMPKSEQLKMHNKLNYLENKIAENNTPAEGIFELLAFLQKQNANLGIVTRNSLEGVEITLRVTNLQKFFEPKFILGREFEPHKPNGAAIKYLLNLWNAKSEETVMLGDFKYDLQAGKDANCKTIHVDTKGDFRFSEFADLETNSLKEILQTLILLES